MAKIGWKIWLLLIILALSILAISPSFKTGVIIKSVEPNSTAHEQGIQRGEIIKSINGKDIKNLEDYTTKINELFPTPNYNKTNNKIKLSITTNKNSYILFTSNPPEIIVKDLPSTRIQTGLDLQGGARALVKPEVKLTTSEMNDLIAVTSERLNVFGLSDITIKPVKDLAGNNFMLIEIAGATPKDLQDLVSKQGKFEAKIANQTVFIGGNQDITSVCRNDASCSGIYSCNKDPSTSQYFCTFRFTITLSPKAANHYAEVTKDIPIDPSNPQYLSEKINFFLDDSLTESLFISKELKGSSETKHQIQGSGVGETQEEAFLNSQQEMKKLQTILLTGSLPYKLTIEKLDTISPALGGKFIYYLFLSGVIALLAVAIIVFFRYKRIKTSLAILFTIFSEIIIILGIASLIKWNLDLPSIAGILIVIGTGVDQLIIITDESHLGKQGNLIEKLKRALFIIVGAYFTSLASLIPLYWAGAGLLKGFAVTTIIGITTGVLITRPAFAEMLKKIESQ